MSRIINRRSRFKHYTRLVLGLFVLSVMNLSIQIPAHAVMLQSMDSVLASQHTGMMQMESPSCECPPVLCESVVSLDHQLIDGLQVVSFAHLTGFQILYVSAVDDHHHQVATQLNMNDRLYRQSTPPPLSITSILHI